MTEIIKNNEWVNQTPDNFQNNLSTKDLKNEIINSLKDWKISPDEAKTLKEIFWEINNINAEARKKWSELSLEIRKDFQNKIWAVEDLIIWKETLTKLENISKIQIPLNNPETKKLSENLGKSIDKTRNSLSNLWINLDGKNPPKNIFIENTWDSVLVYNETSKITKKVTSSPENIWVALNNFNSLWEEWARDLWWKVSNNFKQIEDLGYKIKSVEFSTQNDNIPPIAKNKFGNVYWDDQWNSYWFNIRTEIEKWGNLYVLKWDISAYTDGTEIKYLKDWKKAFVDNSWKDFLDVSNIQLLKEFYKNENEKWDFIKVNVWWWIQARWVAPDFMKKIQNSWHKTTDSYVNDSSYNWEKWFSATTWVEITWKKYMSWDKNAWVYIWWNMNSTFALDNSWMSSINAEWFVWANYKKLDLQTWMWWVKTFWWQSEVLKFANWQSSYFYGRMSVPLWNNLSTFAEVRVTPDKIYDKNNNMTEWKFWLKYNF